MHFLFTWCLPVASTPNMAAPAAAAAATGTSPIEMQAGADFPRRAAVVRVQPALTVTLALAAVRGPRCAVPCHSRPNVAAAPSRAGWPRPRWHRPPPESLNTGARQPPPPLRGAGAARGQRPARPRRRGLLAAAVVRAHRPRCTDMALSAPTPGPTGPPGSCTLPGEFGDCPAPVQPPWAARTRHCAAGWAEGGNCSGLFE